MRVLVVGANGQLGRRLCAELVSRGHEVRGAVRRADRGESLAALGVEVAVADPAAPEGLTRALPGVDAVFLTANIAAPRPGDDFSKSQRSFERVVTDAEQAGVPRFCLVSAPKSPVSQSVPLEQGKTRVEELLHASAMEDVVLRFPPFMEVWLALVGSSLPTRGEENPTADRPSPFLQRFRRMTGRLVEERGLMLVPGSAGNRNAFISIADVARACAEALERPGALELEVGGPEVLSWRDVADIFGEVLDRRVRILTTPGPVYGVMARALAPFAPVPSATMALNRMAATSQTLWSPGGGGLVDPSSMVTVRGFLEAKARLT